MLNTVIQVLHAYMINTEVEKYKDIFSHVRIVAIFANTISTK